MRITSIRPEVQQWLSIGVPLVALALSLLVVYPAYGQYRALQTQVAVKRDQLGQMQAAPIAPPGPVMPTAPEVPTEAPEFLGEIRALAAESGCQLVGFDITPSAATPAAGAVHPVRSKVDLESQYPQVRDFLARLTGAPRLFAVSDLTLTSATAAGQSGAAPGATPTHAGATVHAAIEIERYVTPVVPAPPAKTVLGTSP